MLPSWAVLKQTHGCAGYARPAAAPRAALALFSAGPFAAWRKPKAGQRRSPGPAVSSSAPRSACCGFAAAVPQPLSLSLTLICAGKPVPSLPELTYARACWLFPPVRSRCRLSTRSVCRRSCPSGSCARGLVPPRPPHPLSIPLTSAAQLRGGATAALPWGHSGSRLRLTRDFQGSHGHRLPARGEGGSRTAQGGGLRGPGPGNCA